jgi:hypothetical protein
MVKGRPCRDSYPPKLGELSNGGEGSVYTAVEARPEAGVEMAVFGGLKKLAWRRFQSGCRSANIEHCRFQASFFGHI